MVLKFIDLFAGLGGTRIGFENACEEMGVKHKCVFSSEIKEHAITAYKNNFKDDHISGDITQIPSNKIPDFDFLLAGFPCQPFSAAGSRHGFLDTRGTLFFEIERILKDKSPSGFLLENVEGLVNHDKIDKSKPYGRTLETILFKLSNLGYKVTYKVLNAADFGVPQNRKRIYILGSRSEDIDLTSFKTKRAVVGDVLETGLKTEDSPFIRKLLKKYSIDELKGKSIKDKRGGENNIHSWDIGLKGAVSAQQRKLLSELLKQRRQKKWAEKKGIKWMDGMPLTLREIRTFFNVENLKEILDDLVNKGYLKFEYPKDISIEHMGGRKYKEIRKYATDKEKGYNIVTGKLSFEINKILSPDEVAPTLVATDVTRIYVPDGKGIRRLSVREGLRLSGFPDWYKIKGIGHNEAFDLLGNTVIVPVISEICKKYLAQHSTRLRLVA